MICRSAIILYYLPVCSSPLSTDAQSRHTKLDVRHPAHFDHQGAQVWRVAWNVTGTILASSGDDGCVRLWKGTDLTSFDKVSVSRGAFLYHCVLSGFEI